MLAHLFISLNPSIITQFVLNRCANIQPVMSLIWTYPYGARISPHNCINITKNTLFISRFSSRLVIITSRFQYLPILGCEFSECIYGYVSGGNSNE